MQKKFQEDGSSKNAPEEHPKTMDTPGSQIDNKPKRHHLPNEVPIEIQELMMFYGCGLEDRNSYALDFAKEDIWQRSPALALSAVCARWRNIVRSSPRLWSSFWVNIARLTPKKMELLKLYIQCSGSHILTRVSIIDVGNERENLDVELAHTGWQSLVVVLGRVVELQLELGNPSALPTHLHIPSLPNLSCLVDRSDFGSSKPVSYQDSWWKSFLSAPRLMDVEILFPSDQFLRHFAGSNVMTLSIKHATGEDVFDLLSSCTHVRSFRVYELAMNTFPPNSKSLIIVETLTSIYLAMAESNPLDSLIPLLSTLTLPSLRSFGISAGYHQVIHDPDDWDEEKNTSWRHAVASLIQRSGCSLEELGFQIPDILIPDVIDFLPSCPKAHSLMLRIEHLYPREDIAFMELLQRLHPDPKVNSLEPLLPLLCSLILWETIGSLSEEEMCLISDFVESRSRSGLQSRGMKRKITPLRRLTLLFQTSDEPEEEEAAEDDEYWDEKLDDLWAACQMDAGGPICDFKKWRVQVDT